MSTIAVDSIEAKTSGGAVSFPNKPMFQVGLSAYQAVANATLTKINFNDGLDITVKDFFEK